MKFLKKWLKWGNLVNQSPTVVDKIFWLVGSGKFENSGVGFIGRKREEFIKIIKK